MTAYSYARDLARDTPAYRNRYVDLLRAVSIMVVVFGHWLMAAPFMGSSGLSIDHLLNVAPWTHHLTWLLQVMPIFFFVGGYSNAQSWRSSQRKAEPYGSWLRARLRRLMLPVLPLLAVWTVGAFLLLRSGFDPALLRLGSQAALVPVWFLATYVVVVAFTPITLGFWERRGWASILITGAIAGLIDLISLGWGVGLLGYFNYLFVWGTVHSLGYAWADARIGGVSRRLALSLSGLIGAGALVAFGPYPVAMVGLDTAGVNNTQPPKVTLLLLGLFQAGLLLALEGPARSWLDRERTWAMVVLLNGRIMTVYLWHLTAMVALIGASLLFGGFGLGVAVNTPAWWLTRPVWIGANLLATIPFLAVFGRFERPNPDPRPAPPVWRPVAAVVATCAGLGLLAYYGIADQDGLNGVAITLPFAAAFAGGIAGARFTR